MASTVISSISFHWNHHVNGEGKLHLEKELKHYWEGNCIDIDFDKSKPDISLENIIKFIENTSNILASKIDYFLVKEVHLTSNKTHKKLLQKTFKKVITPDIGGHGKAASKTFKQEIKIINSDKCRILKKEQFLRHQHDKIHSLKSDVNASSMELENQKAAFQKELDDWFIREKYKWEIIRLQSKSDD